MNVTPPGIRQWRPETGREPVVRIGVALVEDGMASLRIDLPGDEYEISTPGGSPRRLRGAKLTFDASGGAVDASVDGQPPATGERWSLAPVADAPLACGRGARVHDLVTGRGFHWQKRMEQVLPGRLEVSAVGGKLVLVNVLPLEAYLAGVITSEMSSQCPPEFLRAQCVAARSWLLAFTEPKHDADPFDRCNDDCCQRYQGTEDLTDVAIDAAESTRGLVLLAEGKVVDANYSKSCGGIVELPEHVWGIRKPGLGVLVDAPPGDPAGEFNPVTDQNLSDYLRGDWLAATNAYCSPNVVPDDQLTRFLGRVDEAGQYFRWTVTYSHDELAALLQSKMPELAGLREIRDLAVTKRGVSGRATEIAINWLDAAGRARRLVVPDQYRIRQILHRSFLYSSAFDPQVKRDGSGRMESLALVGAGWGHGAGLCQIGALGMSLRGIGHEAIVLHYFPGAELRRVY